ncbi:MAG: CopG family transcriptional regulator [Clostridia bacterium]|nr:CopG family transcriptional regulator [Clostridia bacterium]
MKRIGVVGIVIKGDRSVSIEMQKVLTEFGDIIVGRMGVPRNGASAISLIVEGTVERISALTGRLGKFNELAVKSALTTVEIEE